MEDHPEVLGAVGDLDVHQTLHRSGVTVAVSEAADSADPFHDVGHLLVVPGLGQLLQSSVDVSDGGDCPHDLLILELQVQMDGLRKGGVLGSERDYGALAHQAAPSSFFSAPFQGVFTDILKKLPL